MMVRRLLAPDAPAFRDIRLEGLRDHPEAFGSSVREDEARPLSSFEQGLEQGFVLGGEMPDGRLGGVAGLRFNQTDRTRHKAWLWGMYVRPQARGVLKEIGQEEPEASREMHEFKTVSDSVDSNPIAPVLKY